MAGQGPVLLRDMVSIPDVVHDGDFVLALSKGVGRKDTITSYVVTDALAANFDKALGLIKSALETGSSRAAYLDGSFGSGKSHFMAVLHAILSGDADARGKKGLADVGRARLADQRPSVVLHPPRAVRRRNPRRLA